MGVVVVAFAMLLGAPLAQERTQLRGQVRDAVTSKAIVGARVEIASSAATTDANGRFALASVAGAVTLAVHADGYLTETTTIEVRDRDVELDIRMTPLPDVAETVTVTGALGPVASTREITSLDTRALAGGGENIFRVLQTLPGVAAADEFGSRISVRGGGPDQNLTLMDGVEIYNPYRLFGLTSAFNPETVERFELSAGGFSARYGDRLSSVLVVENRGGNQERRFSGSATLGLTDANFVGEGSLPGVNKGSWLVTARRTYYDLVAERFIDTDLPAFEDLQAHIAWEPRPGRRLTFLGLTSRERGDAQLEGDAAGERFGLRSATRNAVAAATFSSPLGARISSTTLVSWYRNREALDVNANFRNSSKRSNRPEDSAAPIASLAFARNYGVRDVALRQDLTFTASASHRVEAGFEQHSVSTDWAWRIVGDRNPHETNASTMFGGSALPALLVSTASAPRAGAWLIDHRTLGRVQLESGLRLDWSGLAREVNVSPRIAARIDMRGIRWRMSAGRFTQSPGYEKLLQADYFVDLSDARARELRSARAWHAVAGAERPFANGWVARAEAYYKTFDRLIVGRAERPEDTATRVGAYDFPDALAGSVPRGPRITTEPANLGSGYAAGVDWFLARQARATSDRLTGWLAYTFGRTQSRLYGRRFPLDYDRTHAFSIVTQYRVRPSLEVAATLRAQSGFPYTPAVGVRAASAVDAEDVDGDGIRAELIPQRDEQGAIVWEADMGGLDNLNAGRLPPFARLDARVTFRPRWSNSRWQFYLDVINVLNRANAGSLEPVLEYDPTSDRPRLSTTREGGVPRLPSLGIRYRF